MRLRPARQSTVRFFDGGGAAIESSRTSPRPASRSSSSESFSGARIGSDA